MVLPEEYPVDYETEDGYKRIGTAGYIIPRIAKYVFEDEDLFTFVSVSSSKYLSLDLDSNEVILSEDLNDYWLIHVVDKENNLYKFEYIGYYEPAELMKEESVTGLAETSRKTHRAKSFLGLVEIEDDENTDSGKKDTPVTPDTENKDASVTENKDVLDTENKEEETPIPLYLTEKDGKIAITTDEKEAATTFKAYFDSKSGNIAIKTISDKFIITNAE